uniref:Calponin-homology (CH) domain-containing protein n=1 Tax=Macrostomum lignano TaxID=282301 RepID=A0A1I8FA72_9PLAT
MERDRAQRKKSRGLQRRLADCEERGCSAEMPEIDRLSQSVGLGGQASRRVWAARIGQAADANSRPHSDRLQRSPKRPTSCASCERSRSWSWPSCRTSCRSCSNRSNRQRSGAELRASSSCPRRSFNARRRKGGIEKKPSKRRNEEAEMKERLLVRCQELEEAANIRTAQQRRNGGVVESPEPADEQRAVADNAAAAVEPGARSWCGQTPDVNMAASPHNNGCSAAAGGAGGAAAEKAASCPAKTRMRICLSGSVSAELQQRNQAAAGSAARQLVSGFETQTASVSAPASSAVASRSTSTIATSALTSTLASTWSSTSAAVLSDRNRLSAGGIQQQQQQQQQPPPPPQPSSSSAEPVVPAKKTLVYSIEMNPGRPGPRRPAGGGSGSSSAKTVRKLAVSAGLTPGFENTPALVQTETGELAGAAADEDAPYPGLAEQAGVGWDLVQVQLPVWRHRGERWDDGKGHRVKLLLLLLLAMLRLHNSHHLFALAFGGRCDPSRRLANFSARLSLEIFKQFNNSPLVRRVADNFANNGADKFVIFSTFARRLAGLG